jgi:Holliday junction DNA helicase RuvA
MIASIKGKVTHIDTKYAIVETGDIGYKVFMTMDTIHGLTKDEAVSLWTYMAIRDDAMDIYGFKAKKEKDFFELLISVSSIGPKSALNILSIVNSDMLASAIRSGSTTHLVKVSGIGRKTAEKIVLELKDKLGAIGGIMGDGDTEFIAGMSSDMDAIEALKALGYDADEAREALKKIDKKIEDTGQKVKAALKMLG